METFLGWGRGEGDWGGDGGVRASWDDSLREGMSDAGKEESWALRVGWGRASRSGRATCCSFGDGADNALYSGRV